MFRFPLQRVLELREKKEQEAAVTLTAARELADEARQACLALEQAREHSRGQISAAQGGGVTVGHLQNFSYVLQHLDRQISSAHQEMAQAEAKVARCLDDLTTASQDRQVLDRLREKKLQVWQAEEVLEDRNTMDAIALTRFARSNPANEGAE